MNSGKLTKLTEMISASNQQVTKDTIHFHEILRTHWFLLDFEKDKLQKFYLLRWESDYTRQRLRKNLSGLKLEHEGTNYEVIFHNASLELCFAADYCFLSFRKALDGYAAVIIKPMWRAAKVKDRVLK